ncbi:MAG: thioredoxin family protein, partial [Acidobacteria bacterium]|nr:thioredoxin family protein [Acidobacteriota bacterium]
MELVGQYKGKLDLVVLDVSNEQTLAEATKTARRLGIGKFFDENQRKTSTVAVFAPGNKILFQTVKNFDREAYVKAFDEAIAKG